MNAPLGIRMRTAVTAVPALLMLLFLAPRWAFEAAAVGALLLALFEFYRMLPVGDAGPLRASGAAALLLLLAPSLAGPVGFFREREILLGVLVLLLAHFAVSGRSLERLVPAVGGTLLGAVFLGIFGSFLVDLGRLAGGEWHLLWLLLAVWTSDIGGYAVGSALGRHQLAPRLSPKKTWEGLAGAVAFGAAGLAAGRLLIPFHRDLYGTLEAALLGAGLALAGQAGDLVESLFKRSGGVKDSGAFFPGHGGVFDRLDSVLWAAPALYFYVTVGKGWIP